MDMFDIGEKSHINYVTPAQFAKISGASRQALIFYEKKGIFFPEYKNANGYRFYLLTQLDLIVAIQSLQQVGLSLDEIKNYIHGRDSRSTYELFSSKIGSLRERVSNEQKIIEMMSTKCQLIKKAENVITDMVYVEYHQAKNVIKSPDIPFDCSKQIQYEILGEHMRFRKDHLYLLGHAVCGISEWKRILENGYQETQFRNYYTILGEGESDNHQIIPAGNYLVIYHKGNYYSTYTAYQMFADYAQRQHLILDDVTFEESLIDELTEADPNNYITQISVAFRSM